MPKVVKEFLLDESTGNVTVEFNDDSTATFNLSNAIGHSLEVTDYLKLETNAPEPAHEEGILFYDVNDHSLAYYNDDAEVKVNVGREQLVRVYNYTNEVITNGAVVYVSGANTGWPTVALARADQKITSESTLGVATSSIEAQTYGYVCVSGTVHDVDTKNFTPGTALYLSATQAGAFTSVPVVQPNYLVEIGTVLTSVTSGRVFVQIDHKDWHPSLQVLDASASITLPTTPTVYKAPTAIYNDGFTYSNLTGEITIDNSGSYSFVLTFNAIPSASNKHIYFYAEEDLGSGWHINRYSARKLKLENATEEQVSITAARYFTKGSKVRFVIWGDSTVYLKSTDLPGTTPGTATLAAFRFQIA